MPNFSKIFKKNSSFWLSLSAFVLMILFGLVLSRVTGVWGNSQANILNVSENEAPEASDPIEIEEEEETVYSLNIEDAPFKGEYNAPVTLVEFSDFQCPVCGRFAVDVLKPLQPLIDAGQLKVVFMHFPIKSVHPYAELMAEAAECMRNFNGDEGFWEFHDIVFENQAEWTAAASYEEALNYVYGYVSYFMYGSGIKTCIAEHTKLPEIADALVYADELNLEGAPAYFINGHKYIGRPENISWEEWYGFVYGEIMKELSTWTPEEIPVTP